MPTTNIIARRKYRVGLDLGGSKILALLLDERGKVIDRIKKRTKPELGYSGLCDRMARMVRNLCAQHNVNFEKDLLGLGMGVPGPVIDGGEKLRCAVNLGWKMPHPLTKDMSKRLNGLPVWITNDVNAGALAEARMGAGRKAHCVYGLFVGTGLGGGLVVDGQVINGFHGLAGEVGHMVAPIVGEAQLCSCGQHGCVETLVSKKGIQHLILRHARRHRHPLGQAEKLSASDLKDAVDDGDAAVLAALKESMQTLAWTISVVTCVVDPDVVVLGGGVMTDLGKILLPMLDDSLDTYKFLTKERRPRLTLAALGDDAVALGGSLLVSESKT
jgi:glucokinase